MTQPKRPISRSSTPIEFTPLILDLEPEVKEEPKKKRGGSFLLMTVVGIVIVLGALSYLATQKECHRWPNKNCESQHENVRDNFWRQRISR